ncbi:cytochrome P450 [Aspergillus keveii]|uniref:Cytochrome P450 n=1 Tax=Aspergillus keveii TaxID=714993 RepID=A0ABR4FIE4_9EURO
MTAGLKKVKQYSVDQNKKRLQAGPQQADFLTRMLQSWKEEGLSLDELQAQADVPILAGSETSATALSGTFYYLSRNPAVYQKLADESRRAFKSYEEMTSQATEPLPYLKAVIEEGLRIYPPVPIGLPRVSPGRQLITTISEKAPLPRSMDPDCKDDKNASRPFILGSRACLGRK